MSKSYTELVKEFQDAFDPGATPFEFDAGAVMLREQLLTEEYQEYLKAENTEDLLDALADIVYIAIGTAIKFGLDFDGAFKEVHASNMSKLGTDGKPIINGTNGFDISKPIGKVLKGPNYFQPDLSKYV